MEQIIKFLIYLHAFLGGLGLATGMISILVKKGGANHIKSGKIFSYTMILSALISLFVAQMPKHENLFLFLIGIFTIYMVLVGNRALTLKNTAKAAHIDKLISGLMLLISATMIVIGMIGMTNKIDNSILYLFFGGFGIFMTFKDFQTYKSLTKNKNAGIKSHIGRMVGSLIASLTAFLVAGLQIGTLLVLIAPTILGTAYIIYWNRKFKIIKTATS